MTTYYNDNDPYVTAWLRRLVADERLPPGRVDGRSIQDVQPEDIADVTQAHFFAGIGGWPLALQLAGWPADQPVWTGSPPCQPFSQAGRGRGEDDPRHLWPEWHRLISQCRPPVIFGEQVASPLGRAWLAGVRADLEELGYAVGAADLCAAGIGAPHIRQRIYWGAVRLAESYGGECDRRAASVCGDHSQRTNTGRPQGDGGATCGRAPSGMVQPDGAGSQQGGSSGATARHGQPVVTASGSRGVEHTPASRRAQGGCNGACNPTPPGQGPDAIHGHAGTAHPRMGNAAQQQQPGRTGQRGATGSGGPTSPGASCGADPWSGCDWLPCLDGVARPARPGALPLAHGLPRGLAALRAGVGRLAMDTADADIRARIRAASRFRRGTLQGIGNAIVPQIAAEFVAAFMESL